MCVSPSVSKSFLQAGGRVTTDTARPTKRVSVGAEAVEDVRNNALDLLSQWHIPHPHRWPLTIIMEIWEEIHWRFLEELKDVPESPQTITLNELKFHALLPGPDGQAWLRMPSTFDIEKPDSWFQSACPGSTANRIASSGT